MAIRWDKLTVKAQEAMQRANDLASEHGNPELQPVHILAGLIEDREIIVPPLLVSVFRTQAMDRINQLPRVSGGGTAQAALSNAANQMLDNAFNEASNLNNEFVSTGHLLLGMIKLKSDAAREILSKAGATYDSILLALTAVGGNPKVTDQNAEGKKVTGQNPDAKYSVCCGRSRDELQDAVNKAIQNGWQPFGGVSVSMSVMWTSGQYRNVAEEQAELWCQAVVRGSTDKVEQRN